MKRSETQGQGAFSPVLDSRNRRLSGLYIRNRRYYGMLWAVGRNGRKNARRFPLMSEEGEPIRNVTDAKAALAMLKAKGLEEKLPPPGHKPSFDSFAAEYLAMQSTRAKKTGTLENEAQAITRWRSHLGTVRVDRIDTPLIKAFAEMRMSGGPIAGKKYGKASPRTANLDLVILRNVLKAAVEAGHLRDLPKFPKIKAPPPRRRALLTPAQFGALLTSCTAAKPDGSPVTKNGEQLCDFLRVLAFCGAREQEALRMRWAHVDFERRRLFIGAGDEFTATGMSVGTGGTSKKRGSRAVDFNPQLEAVLREMDARRPPDSAFVFPSPQRGAHDFPAKSLRESFNMVRAHAGLPDAGFHDLRHLFCSFAVMAGIDFMTIAKWLGHKDGGILIGKVYGHLLDEHSQRMAARLTIGIAPVELSSVGRMNGLSA